jgi:UDP-N-acetylglucosamine transferase subunit ALG13
MQSATIVVGHAGIGTMLNARLLRKPVVLFPRRAKLGEHRNDHQLATAAALAGRPGIGIARNDNDLRDFLLDPAKIGVPDHNTFSSGEELKTALSKYLAKIPLRALSPLREDQAKTEMTS